MHNSGVVGSAFANILLFVILPYNIDLIIR